MDTLLSELKERYGQAEGLRLFHTVMPRIMGDFNKMLKKSAVGKTISEEYHIDDGTSVIVLKGCRLPDGSVKTEAHME